VKKASDLRLLAGAVVLVAVAACSGGQDTGPGEVRWDRVTCERCIMAVSDRHFSAQVRGGPAEKKSRLHYFDDLGCAVLWLQEQPWQSDPRTEIWVTDANTGQWLDALSARYETGFITPMDFGFGAGTGTADTVGTLSYDQAVQVIREKETGHRPAGNQ
jgi:copper chaperone NosL